MLKSFRFISTFTKLWIKHNGHQAIKVSIAGCDTISDLAEVIKEKLPNQLSAFDLNQITIHSSLSANTPLKPDLPISNISDAGLSADSPLYVKTHEFVSPHQKTIFIRNVDPDDGDFLDTYTMVTLRSDRQAEEFYKSFAQGAGFVKVDDSTTLLTTLDELENGKKYQVYSFYVKSEF